MNKATIALILTLIILSIQWDNRERELMVRVDNLQAQVQQLNTELQSTKSEMIQLQLRQAVAEDISDRAGWK